MGNYNSRALEELQRSACAVDNVSYVSATTVPNDSASTGETPAAQMYDSASPPEPYATPAEPLAAQVYAVLYTKVVVTICVLGLIGNVLNLAVLVPKGINCSLGRIEKFAYSGLIALALSDMMFCLLSLPRKGLGETEQLYNEVTFQLFYETYGDVFINITVLCSTWLTVALALGRYLAICHPLRARELIGMTFAKRSLFCVITCCILFNFPRFWEFQIAEISCEDTNGTIHIYFKYESYMKVNTSAATAYTWMYFICGILLPFLLLAFCNWHLICALRHAQVNRRSLKAQGSTEIEVNNNLTLVLVTIVVLYVVLVTPAELVNCLRHNYFGSRTHADATKFNLIVAVLNTMQTLNFSVNFSIYYIINSSFRTSFVRLVTCRWKRVEGRRPSSSYVRTSC